MRAEDEKEETAENNKQRLLHQLGSGWRKLGARGCAGTVAWMG